jgi:hypothetical protein
MTTQAIKERDEAVLAAAEKLAEERLASARERSPEGREIQNLQAARVEAFNLAGRAKSWGEGERRDERKPFPDLNAGQVKASLERLAEAGKLHRERMGRGVIFRPVKLQQLLVQAVANRQAAKNEIRHRWDALDEKLKRLGIGEVGRRQVRWGEEDLFFVGLETAEKLVEIAVEAEVNGPR